MAKPIDGRKCQEWAKHLRKYCKRKFNKQLRAQQRKEVKND